MENYFCLFEDFWDCEKNTRIQSQKINFQYSYVFSNEKIDLLKEYVQINFLAKKHSFPEFCVSRYLGDF